MTIQQKRPPLLQVTDKAREQIEKLLVDRGKPSLGIRIGIRTRGCSGLSYTLEYADTSNPQDELIETETFKIFVDPKAVMFLLGTNMDFLEEKLQAGFVFTNPNEKGRCGCGESFHV